MFVLALALALSLAACGTPQTEGRSRGPAASVSEPPASSLSQAEARSPDPAASVSEPPAPSLPQAADVPPGSYAPWQEAYAEFLKDLRTAEYRYKLGELTCPGDDKPVEVYSLYDVDKDGVPELFLKRGTCEADFSTQVYTFRDGQISGLGSFSSGHSGLYTVPEEKAVLVWYSHMGYGDIEKFVVTDGNSFVHGETLLSEDEDDTRWDGYTVPGEVVPGSQEVPSYYIDTTFRSVDSPALLLPVFDFQGREFSAPMEEAEVRAMVDQVLHQNRPFWGVSGEGFDGDTGLITWTEYLQPGSTYRYGKQTMEVKELAWTDVNGDGQTDCLLRLEQEEYTFYVVLSPQGEEVYAYFFQYLLGSTVDNITGVRVEADGTVAFMMLEYLNWWERVSFYKNQCYTARIPEPAQGDSLAWETFPS